MTYVGRFIELIGTRKNIIKWYLITYAGMTLIVNIQFNK